MAVVSSFYDGGKLVGDAARREIFCKIRPKEEKLEITGVHATWQPYSGPAGVKRSDLPDDVFAFPEERAEPLTDAVHVRSAIARFNSVHGVTDAERDLAFQNILKAADYYSVSVSEKSWHEIGHHVSETY